MEDRPTQTDLAENGGDRPATISQTICTGQSGMVTTCDNGYVHKKPLKKKEVIAVATQYAKNRFAFIGRFAFLALILAPTKIGPQVSFVTSFG